MSRTKQVDGIQTLRNALAAKVAAKLDDAAKASLVVYVNSLPDVTDDPWGIEKAKILESLETAPALAVAKLVEDYCLTLLSIDRFDDKPWQLHESVKAKYTKINTARQLRGAKTVLGAISKRSLKESYEPPLAGDPDPITDQEIRFVDEIMKKAIAWCERWAYENILQDTNSPPRPNVPRRAPGAPGTPEPLLKLILYLHCVLDSVGFNLTESSKEIALWINHFSLKEHNLSPQNEQYIKENQKKYTEIDEPKKFIHSWFSEYRDGQRIERTPRSIAALIQRNRG